MDMREAINMTDARRKQGSQYPASGYAPIGLGTGVHAMQNEDQCKGRN